jgi:beta-xylosidase
MNLNIRAHGICKIALLCFGMIIGISSARSFADVGNLGPWGDQADGTFKNPIIPSDYSDLDAIRVGDDFYAMSSTFQFSPGVIILHSKDLVNWTIAGHAVSDLTQIGPEMNWDQMARYGKGIWAGAIRFHDARFWVYFGTPDEGYFVTTAKDVAGPWEPLHPVLKEKGWDDCCPVWDEDGQGYLVGSSFRDAYKIHLFKLTPDGREIAPGFDKVIHQSRGSEANKLYKINGFYYHFYSEVHSEGRVAMMERTKSLSGDWETHQLNHVNAIDKGPNQGGLIELASGDWWFITHQGKGDWEGRAMCLLPITWVDGWPIIGKVGADGIGEMVWSAKKPIDGFPIATPQASDEFDGHELGQQWEWNYQPRNDKWSLTERPGFLRLHAFKPLQKGTFLKAGNTLSQRCIRADKCEVTMKMNIASMTDGQQAGLCHFAQAYSTFGIQQSKGTRNLLINDNGKTLPGPAINSPDIWLRSAWGQDGVSQYAYSIDGTHYTSFGGPYQLKWGHYRGDRVGIFTYNDDAETGLVDVDWFHFDYARSR